MEETPRDLLEFEMTQGPVQEKKRNSLAFLMIFLGVVLLLIIANISIVLQKKQFAHLVNSERLPTATVVPEPSLEPWPPIQEEIPQTFPDPTIVPYWYTVAPPATPISTEGFKTFSSNSDFFHYTFKAPASTHVDIPTSAGTGWIQLVHNGVVQPQPYGIHILQTALSLESARNGAFKAEFDASVPGDVTIGGFATQMLQGKDTETVYKNERDAEGTPVEYWYTKYLFSNGEDFYIVSIQTDAAYTDYNVLKTVLSTWKFE